MNCKFCNRNHNESLLVAGLVFAIEDKYPVTKGHSLVIPHRHVQYHSELTPEERDHMWFLAGDVQSKLKFDDPTIKGFNVGYNDGEVAGQTVPHFHLHIIPRREGDMDNPDGGVRGVIPEKQKY